jgi:secondary thiamine-phosphate synthase enzyme
MRIKIRIETERRTQLVAVTREVQAALDGAGLGAWDGMVYVHSPHTTAGVTLNEQADPDVARDMEKALAKLIPWRDGYAHAEGNSAAHIQTTLVGNGAWVPVEGGRLKMGTWQGIWFCEFDGPRTREVWVVTVKEG